MIGDSLDLQNGQQFSTKDRDNDKWSGNNCAVHHHGAWWYIWCQHSNLNGKYRNVGPGDATGLTWVHWKKNGYSMKQASMKIRPNKTNSYEEKSFMHCR